MTTPCRRRERGVSLIEALVALVVMAFGMLGVVGVQSTLRLNSDIAKQRSEAVRLGQRAIEDARTFTEVTATGGPAFDYTQIANVVAQPIAGYSNNANDPNVTNATYLLTQQVQASGDTADSQDPRLKTLRVQVTWADRAASGNATNEVVELNTAIARSQPALGGALALPSNVNTSGVPTRGAYGRNPNVPAPAVNFGDGTSGYIPPGRVGADQTAWLFNNVTGVITVCTSGLADNAALANYAATHVGAPDPFVCGGTNALLLAGYVAFASDGTAAHALAPDGVAVPATVTVTVSANNPLPAAVITAYTQPPLGAFMAYYSAIPISAAASAPSVWSGSSSVSPLPGLPVVCRYTSTVVPVPNSQHPLAYANVNTSLSQQNFLVIPAASLCAGPLPVGSSTVVSP